MCVRTKKNCNLLPDFERKGSGYQPGKAPEQGEGRLSVCRDPVYI